MNTAIAMFRRLNEDFNSHFPNFEDHGAIIEYLSTGYHDPNSHDKFDEDFATYTTPKFKLPSKIFFCDLTYQIVKSFCSFWMGAELPFYNEDAAKTSGLRFSQDERVLMNCLSLLGFLAMVRKGEDIFNDQLIEGLHIAKNNNTVYTWVAFAVQMYVDTRRVVGKELDRCLNEAHQLQRWMSTTLEQSLLFGHTNTINDYYKLNSKGLQLIKDQMEVIVENDFIQKLLGETLGPSAERYSCGPFYLFRNNPMLLGLIMQHFLVKLHEFGIGLAGDQGVIITSMHLYNASHRSNQVPHG